MMSETEGRFAVLRQSADAGAVAAIERLVHDAPDSELSRINILDFAQTHHLDEERDLFPAVLASAQPGAERERVQAMTERLTHEHRAIETLWKSLEKALKRVGKGQVADLDVTDVHQLVTAYAAHAGYEEKEFLPLSEAILGRNSNHMAALGLSLHMRHVRQPTAYI